MKVSLLAAFGLAVLSIWGCGGAVVAETETVPNEKPAAEKISDNGPLAFHISLDNFMGPENVGILMAAARGYFEQEGLDVTVTKGVKPRRPLVYVNTRVVELGLAHQPQVVMARDEGRPVVAIGSLVSKPTAALIWPKRAGISGIADLKGKTIGIGGIPYERRFLEVILAKHGISARQVKIRGYGHYLVPALLTGRADAIFGGSWNLEGVAMKARGMEPVITRVESLGVPAYDEAVVIARADRLSEDPDAFRAFMAAVARGTSAAISDPAEAAEVILATGERNGEVGRDALAAQLRATLPLLSRNGWMDEEQAAGLIAWMKEQGVIEGQPPVGEMLTNDYLSGS